MNYPKLSDVELLTNAEMNKVRGRKCKDGCKKACKPGHKSSVVVNADYMSLTEDRALLDEIRDENGLLTKPMFE